MSISKPEIDKFTIDDALWLVFASYEKRLEAVNHRETPDSVLAVLVDDDHPDVREGVAAHQNVSTQTLDSLASDTDSSVRQAVARNVNTSRRSATKLAFDTNEKVRFEVASHLNVPAEVMTVIFRDDEGLGVPLSNNQSAPVDLLTDLAVSVNKEVRAGVAANTNTPVSVLEMLGTDDNEFVRYCVARNPKTPEDLRNRVVTTL